MIRITIHKFWIFVVLFVGLFYWLASDNDIHTRKFCAYGQEFVEFEHDGKVWGTTFLDRSGKPVGCEEEDIKTEPVNSWKNTI